MAEQDSDLVRAVMASADGWFMCRVGYVETARAVAMAAGPGASAAFLQEWPAFGVIEVDQELVESAADLAAAHDLRSLDALHFAAALILPPDDLVLATCDRRLHSACITLGVRVIPGEMG